MEETTTPQQPHQPQPRADDPLFFGSPNGISGGGGGGRSRSIGVDEWVFSVRVPVVPESLGRPDATATTATSNQHDSQQQQQQHQQQRPPARTTTTTTTTTLKERLFQLRQFQPPHPSSIVVSNPNEEENDDEEEGKDPSLKEDEDGDEDDDDKLYDEDINVVRGTKDAPNKKEREFLLYSGGGGGNQNKPTTTTTQPWTASSHTTTTTTTPKIKAATRTSSSSIPPGGWTFKSPFWTIQSNYILQMTYRPAWQAIPEFTACRAGCGRNSHRSRTRGNGRPTTNDGCDDDSYSSTKTNSFLRTVGSFCCGAGGFVASCCGGCCGGCGSNLTERMDFFTHTWTTADIVQVQTLDNYQVHGIGQCQALQFTLSPLPLSMNDSGDDDDDFPSRPPPHLRAAWKSHVRRMTTRTETAASTTPSSCLEPPFTAADALTDSTMFASTVTAPTVTFCLPRSQIDPPLLWQVQMPGHDQVDIAVETYSILDGKLVVAPKQHDPTHIYINGFQSWSFAGSIVRGHEQPRPAMPQVYSQAFNLGGSPPPPATNTTTSSFWASNPTAKDGDTAAATSSQQQQQQQAAYYQSDFFTCITADGDSPLEKRRTLLQSAVASVRSSHTRIPTQPMTIQEEPFPFQKLDERGGPAAVLGWLSQRQQFGVITSDCNLQRFAMHASADGAILLSQASRGGGGSSSSSHWAYVQLISPHSYDEEPMVHYLHDVAAHNNARPLQNGNLLTGWCSWYHYYNDITESNLRDNFVTLAAMRSHVPTNVAVVDDGYMTAWGDWDSLKPRKFDRGMAQVAQDIAANNMRPGLWLAPFAADKHSQLTTIHPDWVIHNDFGAPANSANCGKFFYGLDATHPKVHDHVYESIRRAVHDWHYNVLKIDFLYAACLKGNGKYNLSISRAQAMHMALDTIRRAAGPDVFLIGCGCPLATAIGYVDGMRISADTGPTWYPSFPLPWWDHGTLPCLRSMVRNSISRAPLGHRWWHNDPDCLLLGESTRLTDLEVASAATVVAMTCGMMLLSDDLTKISMSRTSILTKIFPMTGASAVVLDLHSTNDGLPSLLRLWATDNHNEDLSSLIEEEWDRDLATAGDPESRRRRDFNREATLFARKASFVPDHDVPPPNERKRSCIYAPAGLGSWTIISLSNWSDKTAVLHIPPPALLPPPLLGLQDNEADSFLEGRQQQQATGCRIDPQEDHGYHVLAFWSSRYTWLPPQGGASGSYHHHAVEQQALGRRFYPHETEIFHIKRVTPHCPQYLGSDLHFSCCREVSRFVVVPEDKNTVLIELKTDLNRIGHVFVFLPVINTSNIHVQMNGAPALWIAVGNTPQVGENGSPRLVGRIIRISVTVQVAATDPVVGGQPRSENGKIWIQF
ncbi:hypothetical protein ACA910_012583 [Epithemia clementina (nom. ined.)]